MLMEKGLMMESVCKRDQGDPSTLDMRLFTLEGTVTTQ
jgi:hypothetical protein